MVGPAACGRFLHDYTLELPGAKRLVTHGVSQSLGAPFGTNPGEGQIIMSIVLEGKRSFLESIRKSFHNLWFGGKCQSVGRETSATDYTSCPEDVLFALRSLHNTGVNAHDAFDVLLLCHKGTFRTIADGHTYTETCPCTGLLGFQATREIEIVTPVTALNAVGCPHRIAFMIAPGDLFLTQDDAMVLPMGKVGRREDMIIGHAEPTLQCLDRRDVVGRINIDLVAEDTCRRVGRELS